MTIYKRDIITTVDCSSIEISEIDSLRYELEEIDLDELWEKYESDLYKKKKFPKGEYSREVDAIIDYSLSAI